MSARVLLNLLNELKKRDKMRGLSLVFMQMRFNFPNISYLSETQKNNFQFLNETKKRLKPLTYEAHYRSNSPRMNFF